MAPRGTVLRELVQKAGAEDGDVALLSVSIGLEDLPVAPDSATDSSSL